jgi:Rad3-related DNA helicase
MAKVTITKDNLLSLAEFKALLEQVETRSSTMEYIFRLLRELVSYEEKFNMASDVFYARFMRGEMGDDLPFIKWAGRYELYLEFRAPITI